MGGWDWWGPYHKRRVVGIDRECTPGNRAVNAAFVGNEVGGVGG
jgi:hypothetical protein